MWPLDNLFIRDHCTIAVVGCGGTGGFVAEGLCRLLLDRPHVRLALVDHDRVEERNLGRQNFYPDEDLGRFKALALAERLSRKYRRPIAYSLNPFQSPPSTGSGHRLERSFTRDMLSLSPGVLVGCVDNPLAREALAQWTLRARPLWWVDAGNGEDYGQVLVGNAAVSDLEGAFSEERGVCRALPLPTVQRPDLLAAPAPEAGPDCAEGVAAGHQSPTINQAMAAAVLEAVRRLLEGSCAWMQLHLDLAQGTMHPTYATPDAVHRMTGVPLSWLVDRKPRRKEVS